MRITTERMSKQKSTLSKLWMNVMVIQGSATTSAAFFSLGPPSTKTTTRCNGSPSFRVTRPSSYQTDDRQKLQMSSTGEHCSLPPLPPIPSTSKRLFLVRHGEVIPPGGVHGVFYGALDVPLSPLGEKEAMAAAEVLQSYPLQHVASSPLKRALFGARRTQELQSKRTGMIIVDEGFTELDRGDWCGKTKEEIGDDLMARFNACDESVTPSNGGESYPTVKRRVLEARDRLLEVTTPGKASALVSHLQVTRSILSDALGIPIEDMSNLKIATASITCIDYSYSSSSAIPVPTVHFQSFKPDVGLEASQDGGNVV